MQHKLLVKAKSISNPCHQVQVARCVVANGLLGSSLLVIMTTIIDHDQPDQGTH